MIVEQISSLELLAELDEPLHITSSPGFAITLKGFLARIFLIHFGVIVMDMESQNKTWLPETAQHQEPGEGDFPWRGWELPSFPPWSPHSVRGSGNHCPTSSEVFPLKTTFLSPLCSHLPFTIWKRWRFSGNLFFQILKHKMQTQQ